MLSPMTDIEEDDLPPTTRLIISGTIDLKTNKKQKLFSQVMFGITLSLHFHSGQAKNMRWSELTIAVTKKSKMFQPFLQNAQNSSVHLMSISMTKTTRVM